MNKKMIFLPAAAVIGGAALAGGGIVNAGEAPMPQTTPVAQDLSQASWDVDTASDYPKDSYPGDVAEEAPMLQPAPVAPEEAPMLQPAPVAPKEAPMLQPAPVAPEAVALEEAPVTDPGEAPMPQAAPVTDPGVVNLPEGEFVEMIFDETQSTHWENGGLVVGTPGDALAACSDPGIVPTGEAAACAGGVKDWAADSGLDFDPGKPGTVPVRED